jgi:hypothetical protein
MMHKAAAIHWRPLIQALVVVVALVVVGGCQPAPTEQVEPVVKIVLATPTPDPAFMSCEPTYLIYLSMINDAIKISTCDLKADTGECVGYVNTTGVNLKVTGEKVAELFGSEEVEVPAGQTAAREIVAKPEEDTEYPYQIEGDQIQGSCYETEAMPRIIVRAASDS